MSESNQVELIYVAESPYGETPANSANWKTIRMTRDRLTGRPRTEVSNEIRSDRMRSGKFKTGLDVNGGFDFEYSLATLDDFFAAVMAGTWTTDVLKTGTGNSSVTLQKQFKDLTNKFIAYTGMRSGELSLNFAYGALATGAINFAGNGVSTPATTLVGTGSVASATTTDIMNASSNIGTLQVDGAPVSDIDIRTITLNVNSNLRAIEAIGNDAPVDQSKGSSAVTGSVEIYLSNTSFGYYSDVLNLTGKSLQWTVTDAAGNSDTFLIPNLVFDGDSPQAEGIDTDSFIRLDFDGFFDATAGADLQITRVRV